MNIGELLRRGRTTSASKCSAIIISTLPDSISTCGWPKDEKQTETLATRAKVYRCT